MSVLGKPIDTGLIAAANHPISPSHNPTNGAVVLPVFRDRYKSGNPKPSLANAVIATRALGIGASYDLFHHRIQVTYNGQAQTIREGLLTDDTVSAVRSLINNLYQIDCGDPNADLAGMRRADVEHVKAFASRQVDRARPAYGRVREDRPRRSIEWGTTNNDEYLLSQTGNRRIWPLKTGKIDIEALRRDRESLLGEAAAYEAAGESITLDPSLWGDARKAQEQRRVADPWEDVVRRMSIGVFDNLHIIHRAGDGNERTASADVLLHVLQIPMAQQTTAHGQRLANAMKRAGWGRNSSGNVTNNGVPVRGYIRKQPIGESPTQPRGGRADRTH
jgi:hypothetical protein